MVAAINRWQLKGERESDLTAADRFATGTGAEWKRVCRHVASGNNTSRTAGITLIRVLKSPSERSNEAEKYNNSPGGTMAGDICVRT